ncbi:hypothetical protein CERZMDRAFT_94394 [Cercospora zeae-maydis SCOH1-5]|uniref:Ubiquitin-like domain-containing protein n=1 Tax=Cercospora zeae-maydis SCOH1-5 TaxID=717836 RepID=A0A6A6FRT9_9PEZI|nr:hypothetical protein CERZMDRAFT_94394 [Cercospora zeae-maydis SCOH1-5]
MSASHPGEPPPSLGNSPFILKIQTSEQESFELSVRPTTTAKELKQMIIDKAPDGQRLWAEDGRMYLMHRPWTQMEQLVDQDSFVLGEAMVREGSVIGVVTRPATRGEGEGFTIEYSFV